MLKNGEYEISVIVPRRISAKFVDNFMGNIEEFIYDPVYTRNYILNLYDWKSVLPRNL
jgi:hypothetical protein